ncbi:MAG: formate dehydrogenase accessory sulfurtransferase FdhD [Promethearchaeia archaeon]
MFKRKVKITQIKKNQKCEKSDTVLIEKPINLYLNQEHLVSIICLPESIKELTVGFLYSIGLIDDVTEIKNIKVKDDKIYNVFVDLTNDVAISDQNQEIQSVGRVIETTCGITSPWREIIKKTLSGKKEELGKYQSNIKSETIFESLKQLQTDTTLFRETGGCHGAALFDYEGNLLSLKEDIGRHNAIDKVLGSHLLTTKKSDFNHLFLASTGRLTGDSVLKAIRAGFEIMASLSAAIDSGIKLAYNYNLTLIGFARGSRMNIYTHPDRIII